MASSLFGNSRQPQQGNGIFSGMIRTMFENKYNTDPRFRQFADSVQGKSPEQVCQEYGIDYNDARKNVSDIFNQRG